MHHRVLVLGAEHGADAFERQRHVDVEVRRISGREILRVLVVGLREGVHEQPEHILAARLADQPQVVLGALGQRVVDLGQRISRQLAAEDAAFQRKAPEGFEFGVGGRPRRFGAVQFDGFVAGEVELVYPFFEQGLLELHALAGAAAEHVVDIERGAQVALAQGVVQGVAVLLEAFDVRCQKERPLAVQQAQIAVEDLFGRLIVQRLGFGQVQVAKAIDDADAGARMHRERLEIRRRRWLVRSEYQAAEQAQQRRGNPRRQAPLACSIHQAISGGEERANVTQAGRTRPYDLQRPAEHRKPVKTPAAPTPRSANPPAPSRRSRELDRGA